MDIDEAIRRKERLEPMRAAFRSIIEKRERNASRIPDLEARLERLKRARESTVGDTALLEQAIENLEANGFRVRRADGAAEAVQAVLEELGSEKLLVKSKSNLSKEIGLSAALVEAGVEVVETDIGDRILQLSGEPTVHPTGPCAQLTRYDIAKIVSNCLSREVEPEPLRLIEAIREDLLPRIEKARIGLTSMNAIAAAEGSVVVIHNEGNVDLVSQRPDKLIMLSSPEKVYPDIEEAINMARLETYYATGEPITAFIRVTSGPSRTADIEKEIFEGVHGPAEIVIVMIDNGRSRLAYDKHLSEALYCIGCGSCLLECPVYDIVGPEYGSPGHLGGIGVSLASYLEGLDEAVEGGLPYCTTCRNCLERCPVSLDIPEFIENLRARATREQLLPLAQHKPLIASIKNYDNPWMQPRHNRDRWAKGLKTEGPGGPSSSIFFAGCSLSFLSQDVAKSAMRLLGAAGISPLYLGREERCCGSPLLRLGEEDLFLELARANMDSFNIPGVTEIITACPGCLKTLREYSDYFPTFDIRIRHITEVLAEAVDAGRLRLRAPGNLVVTYHDPCHLGRACGIYDEPRKILSAIEGLTLVEMERNREFSACCGAGGGVKTGFPELAAAIGLRRSRMAEAAGADLIVTSCPWCEQNLADSMVGSEYRVEVKDILELAEESRTGRPYPD
jgi:L-lactate dehydrogenase complex protein LldG